MANFDTITGPKKQSVKEAPVLNLSENNIQPKPKKQKKEKQSKNKQPRLKKGPLKVVATIGKVLFLCFSLIFILFSGAVYAYQSNYEDRALFGTKILGEDVGGKTEKEIKKILSNKVSAISFSFSVDKEEINARPEEAGIVFQIDKSAKKAVEKGKKADWYNNLFYTSSSILYKVNPSLGEVSNDQIKENLELEYTLDEIKLAGFTQSLSEKFNADSKDAGLVMKGTEVEVIPAIYGRKIVTDSVKNQIISAIKSTRGGNIKVDVERVNPALLESDTKASIEAAKTLISKEIVFKYQDKRFVPDKAIVGSWIIFKESVADGKKKLVPEVDPKLVYSYVHSISGKINVAAINKKVTVVNGGEQKVENEGQDGLAVDVDLAAVNTARALTAGKTVDMELPTYAVKYKTSVNNVVVADWAKYLTVDISDQKACAYLAGGNLVNCWSVTTGQSGLDTPIGTHLISRKSGAGGAPGSAGGGVCMPNPPSSTPLCGINFVSTFTPQGHAFHEAWWRSSFGGQDYKWNGSHGCVNVPYSVAEFIYYWAPIGTPVIVQY